MKSMAFRKDVFALLIVIFVDALGWGLFLPVLAPILLDNQLGIFSAATTEAARNNWFEFTIAIYCFGIFFSSPFLGSLSDKIGRKKVLLISMLGGTIGPLICAVGAITHSLTILILGRAFGGITAGSFPVAQAAIIDLSTVETKPKNLGYMVLANGIGFALGPVVGGVLLDERLWHSIHYQWPFIAAGLCGVIGVIAVGSLFIETHEPTANANTSLTPIDSFLHLGRAFIQPVIASLLWVFFLGMTGYAVFFTHLPVWLTNEYHKTGAWIGYFITFYAAIFSFSIISLFPLLVKKYSLNTIIFASLITQIIFYGLFASIGNAESLWFLALGPAIAAPMMYVSLVTALSNATLDDQQGMIMGVASSVAALTWGIGPMLAGISSKLGHFGGFMTALILLSISLVVIILTSKITTPSRVPNT